MTALIRNVTGNMTGISIYGVISVCLFVAVFLGAVWLAWRMTKSEANRMGALPLNDGEVAPAKKGNSHE